MQKIILFGGTFDPPHNGHMALLAGAVNVVQPDRVIVEPAGLPPHKAASATPADVRRQMCACFLPLADRVIVDDTEILREGKSYTVDTLRTMHARYPDAQFYLPMGSDMLLYFRKWRSWREILHLTVLVVQCRDEEDAISLNNACESLKADGAQIIMTQNRVVEVSSTEIRALASAGQSVAHLVPPVAAQIIVQGKLYQNKN